MPPMNAANRLLFLGFEVYALSALILFLLGYDFALSNGALKGRAQRFMQAFAVIAGFAAALLVPWIIFSAAVTDFLQEDFRRSVEAQLLITGTSALCISFLVCLAAATRDGGGTIQESDEKTPPRPRRVQFTVRTFFVAAVLISLFAAVAQSPTDRTRSTALVFLWLTFAGIYWTFRSTSLLVALFAGTVVSAALLGLPYLLIRLYVGFIRLYIDHHFAIPIDDVKFVSHSLHWGAIFSLLVLLSRPVGRIRQWITGQFSYALRQRSSLCCAKPALTFAVDLLLTRVLLSAILLATRNLFPWEVLRSWISLFLLDSPLGPLTLFPWGLSYTSDLKALGPAAVLSCPFYAGMGWIVGFIVAKVDRQR